MSLYSETWQENQKYSIEHSDVMNELTLEMNRVLIENKKKRSAYIRDKLLEYLDNPLFESTFYCNEIVEAFENVEFEFKITVRKIRKVNECETSV